MSCLVPYLVYALWICFYPCLKCNFWYIVCIFFFIFIYLLTFFFIEYSSYPYYASYLIPCLVCAPWTCSCFHTKWSLQYIIDLFYFYFYLFTDLVFLQSICFISTICSSVYNTLLTLPGYIPSILFVYFLFLFIYLLTFFLQNICLISTMCSVSYDTLSVLPGHISALTSSKVSGISLTYFIFIFIYLLTFFFVEHLSYLYYMSSYIQYLVDPS